MNGARPYRRLAMVARWKPVHLGHAAVLEGLVASAEEVWIGIGSANKLDVHNPFTAAETRTMLHAVLGARPGVTVVDVPDLGDPPRWGEMVAGMVEEMVGEIDAFVTANPWVRSILAHRYPVLHPVAFVPADQRIRLSGTMVRRAMARGEDWQGMVPEAVARVLLEGGLVERFRREFGRATLATEGIDP